MSELDSRRNCVCFTGHRPEKLTLPEEAVKAGLEQQIVQAITNGYDLRDNGLPVKLICAVPYPGFGKGWAPEWSSLYQEIIAKADLVETVCAGYNKGCFMARNKWMVDHSNLVIAVFNGEKGGTKNTIDYANKQGVEVRYI